MSLHTWCCQDPCDPSNYAIFMLNLHWVELPQAKKKACVYAHGLTFVEFNSATLWTVACQACLLVWGWWGVVAGFSRQEYWSILASISCHTLLEHCISCCPSCQPP